MHGLEVVSDGRARAIVSQNIDPRDFSGPKSRLYFPSEITLDAGIQDNYASSVVSPGVVLSKMVYILFNHFFFWQSV